MSRFPLEPLSRVRNVRLRCALARVAERRVAFDAAVQVRDEIARRLQAAQAHRGNYRDGWTREMAADAHPADWIRRHERHLDFLDASIREVQQGLETAVQQVSDAQSELELALAEWRQVQSKCDALQSMREAWQASRRSSLERREEQAVEELRLARGAA